MDGYAAGGRAKRRSVTAAMEVRGGGDRSSGKCAAGKMMTLQEFVSSMALLIDLEKVFQAAPIFSLAVDSVGIGDWNGGGCL
jgi:hypothetical protein